MSIVLYKDAEYLFGTSVEPILFRRGWKSNEFPSLQNHAILVEDGIIKEFLQQENLQPDPEWNIVSLGGRAVVPGFVECHTHTAFAGDRSEEFLLKLQGATYEEIAARGGGIISTMKKVRDASEEELLALLLPRIYRFIEQGVTTLEIKSGYGLNTENELKILRAINRAAKLVPIDIVPTFLGAHTFADEYKENRRAYIQEICTKMLPLIRSENLSSFCDGFLEPSAFLPDEIEEIFETAKKLGFALRLHTDQFHSIKGMELGIKMGARSVDHLEVISTEQANLFKDSETAAVLLPGVSYFLNYNYAPARDLIDANAIVALATDYNPGSSHIDNIFFIMSLAAIKMKMSINQIMNAYTINAAYACGMSETTGSLTVGKKADFAVIDSANLNQIIYNIAKNPVYMTIKNGEIIYQRGY